jgi:isopropylmalate/homocitrate/citramalate synthase
MVVTGLRTEPFSGEAYAPEMIGRTRQIMVGKGSGRTSIEWNLEMLGIQNPDSNAVAEIVKLCKEKAIDVNRCLTKEEFRAIVDAVIPQ